MTLGVLLTLAVLCYIFFCAIQKRKKVKDRDLFSRLMFSEARSSGKLNFKRGNKMEDLSVKFVVEYRCLKCGEQIEAENLLDHEGVVVNISV